MKISSALNAYGIERKKQSERPFVNSPATLSGGQSRRSQAHDVDQVETQLDPGRLERFVQELRNMDPSDLHRIEDLKAQIADGSYRADAEDLVDSLMELLEDDGAEL